MIESQSRYINTLIGAVLAAKKKAKTLSIKPNAQRVEDYNAEIQAALATSNFADPRCNSWYKTKEGMITNNWSGTVIDYQKLLSKVKWDELDISGSGSDVLRGKKETNLGRVVEESQVGLQTIAWGLGAVSVFAVVGGIVARNARLLKAR
jgi:hypothetical protein